MKEGDERLVVACTANAEKLPFDDNFFDCYIANLVLNLVNNHKN